MKNKAQRARIDKLQEIHERSAREMEVKKSPKKRLLLVLLLNFELLSDMRFAVVQIIIVGLRNPKNMQFVLILALQVIILALVIIKVLFVRSENGKRVGLMNTAQEVSISLFVFLIVLLENRNDIVQYLMVIALSISIIAEVIIIVLEVTKDVAEVFVTCIKKNIKRVQRKSEGCHTPIRSVKQNNGKPAKRVQNQNPGLNRVVKEAKKKRAKKVNKKIESRSNKYDSTKGQEAEQEAKDHKKRSRMRFPRQGVRIKRKQKKKRSKLKDHLQNNFSGNVKRIKIHRPLENQRLINSEQVNDKR